MFIAAFTDETLSHLYLGSSVPLKMVRLPMQRMHFLNIQVFGNAMLGYLIYSHICFTATQSPCLVCWTLKMEALCSSKTSVAKLYFRHPVVTLTNMAINKSSIITQFIVLFCNFKDVTCFSCRGSLSVTNNKNTYRKLCVYKKKFVLTARCHSLQVPLFKNRNHPDFTRKEIMSQYIQEPPECKVSLHFYIFTHIHYLH
jgi:hypothetical protein